MIHALEHLGENVPRNAPNGFYIGMIHTTVQQIRNSLQLIVIGKHPTLRLTEDQIARFEKMWGQNAEMLSHWQQIALSLREADIATLRDRLKDDSPAVRRLAIQIITEKRLPLEGDLIDQLRDHKVSSAAHRALVRLARGTDFGPLPDASQRAIAHSIEKWRSWLALQQSAAATLPDKAVSVAAKRGKVDPLLPVQLLLGQDSQDVQPIRPEVSRLYDELVNSKDVESRSILAHWRDVAGTDHTDALIRAIPMLPDTIRMEAEDVLAHRLTRLTMPRLREKLQDDQVEVRRAAAFACGRKLANELIPDLVQLLDDPEKDVIQAARAALTELTGEDFGPTKDADRRARADAVATWRKWCKERTVPK